jgi:uncharacterized protein (DUF2252 family)
MTPQNFPPSLSRTEGAAIGKSLREKVPRSSHEVWKPVAHRPELVSLLNASSQGRLTTLVPIRYGRMLASPFAFLRGTASIMALDLSETPKTGIHIQICGDCHLSNFGGFGTAERNLVFGINDFDETLSAPWEWDIKRLVASVVVAGRSLKLSDRANRVAAIAAVQSYREHLNEYAQMTALEVWYAQIDIESLLVLTPEDRERKKLNKEVLQARTSNPVLELHQLTERANGERRFIDNPPLLFHPAPEDPLAEEMRSVFPPYRTTLREDLRVLLDQYRVVDVAMKVVGVGSVGTRCGVALLEAEDDDILFLQIKEARPSVLEPYTGKSACKNHAQRVVAGQRLMQASGDIFLGWSRGSDGHDFYLRQIRNMKTSIDIKGMSEDDLSCYAQLCGWALARSHARSGQRFIISGYLGRSDTFDRAIATFAETYADQTERDYQELVRAVEAGQIDAIQQ